MLLGRYSAVLDACVLHPAFLRASLLWFATERLFRPVWTPEIMEEWERSLKKRFGDDDDRLAKQRATMEGAFPDALATIPAAFDLGATLPDPEDRHVLAAALIAKADAIITINLKDFPAEVCAPLKIEIIHPDDFLVNVIDLHPARAIAACRKHREALKAPPFTAEDFVTKFEAAGLIQTHQRLLPLIELL